MINLNFVSAINIVLLLSVHTITICSYLYTQTSIHDMHTILKFIHFDWYRYFFGDEKESYLLIFYSRHSHWYLYSALNLKFHIFNPHEKHTIKFWCDIREPIMQPFVLFVQKVVCTVFCWQHKKWVLCEINETRLWWDKIYQWEKKIRSTLIVKLKIMNI